MLWRSNMNSADAFTKEVRKDPDFVFVDHANRPLSLSVSGAAEVDPNMTVISANGSWRVHVTRSGRHLKTAQIRPSKRKK